MNPLAFNMQISQLLKKKYQISLGILPIVLMFSSFVVMWPFTIWLAEILDIPDGAPVLEQPNGLLWLILFLLFMVGLMIFGYLLGWLMNALISGIIYKWDAEKTRRVFLRSDVPNDWLKNGNNVDLNSKNVEVNKDWEATRKKGKWNYILKNGVLSWGLIMYFAMAIIPVIRGNVNGSLSYFVWQALLWCVAGAAFGGTMWYFFEKSFIKNRDKHQP